MIQQMAAGFFVLHPCQANRLSLFQCKTLNLLLLGITYGYKAYNGKPTLYMCIIFASPSILINITNAILSSSLSQVNTSDGLNSGQLSYCLLRYYEKKTETKYNETILK